MNCGVTVADGGGDVVANKDNAAIKARIGPNETKMSDSGRRRVSLGVKMWESSQKWSAQRSDVRSIA